MLACQYQGAPAYPASRTQPAALSVDAPTPRYHAVVADRPTPATERQCPSSLSGMIQLRINLRATDG